MPGPHSALRCATSREWEYSPGRGWGGAGSRSRQGAELQAAPRTWGPVLVGLTEGKRVTVISYHLYPNIGGEGLLSLILGVQTRV